MWGVRSQLEAASGLSKPELSSYLLKMNIGLIRRAPVEYLQEVAQSMSIYWFPAAGPLANLDSTLLGDRGPWCTWGSCAFLLCNSW